MPRLTPGRKGSCTLEPLHLRWNPTAASEPAELCCSAAQYFLTLLNTTCVT